jgi:hypothetical protein
MHGVVPGSGAPIGNRNALKYSRYMAEAIAAHQKIRTLLHNARELGDQVSGRKAIPVEIDGTKQIAYRRYHNAAVVSFLAIRRGKCPNMDDRIDPMAMTTVINQHPIR